MRKIIIIIVVSLFIIVSLLVVTGKTLPYSTNINGTNCGSLSSDAAAEKIIKTIEKRKVPIYKDNKKIGELAPGYRFNEKELKARINKLIKRCRFDLLLRYKLHKGYKVELNIVNPDTSLVVKKLKKIDGNNYTKRTKDAYVDYDNFKIVKEVYGDDIDFDKLEKRYRKCISTQQNIFNYISKDFYHKPEILSGDKSLKKELAFVKKYLKGGIDIKNVNIPPSKLRKLIVSTEEGANVVETEAENVAKWLVKNNTFTDKVNVTLHGKKYSFTDQGDLLKVDITKTANSITQAAKAKVKGKSEKASVYFTYKNIDFNKNYVEVSIKKQRLYFYKNGKQKMSSPVVTGSYKHFTPKGAFSVMWKERNATLRGREDDGSTYANKVSYWMPLNERGVGLHDAPWRGSFGGEIYKYSGSHGCINMPSDKAKWLFNHVTEKYPVFIY